MYLSYCFRGNCDDDVCRLFQTPGGAAGLSMRVPKPGEIMMSMDGSPLMNTDQPKGIVVPINDHKVFSCS